MPKDYPVPNDIPVNTVAARIMSKGTHFDPIQKPTHTGLNWDNPPEMQPVPQNLINRIGETQDRMTIVGWYGKGKWVARCVCGLYESRRNRNWVKWRDNPSPNKKNHCRRCEKLEHIRWMATNRHKLSTVQDSKAE